MQYLLLSIVSIIILHQLGILAKPTEHTDN
jgi:hypothetical protein